MEQLPKERIIIQTLVTNGSVTPFLHNILSFYFETPVYLYLGLLSVKSYKILSHSEVGCFKYF